MRKLIALVLVGAGLLLAPAPLVSQTPLPRVQPNAAITLEWDGPQDVRSGGNGAGLSFRALVDGVVTKSFLVSELTVTGSAPSWTYRGQIPGVSTGAHNVVIRSYDVAAGAQPCVFAQPTPTCADSAPPLAFEARVSPLAPSQPRIIITAVVGGIQIELRGPVNAQGQAPVVENLLRIPAVR